MQEPQPTPQPQPQFPSQQRVPGKRIHAEQRPGRGPSKKIFLILALIVIIIVAGVLFFLSRSSEENTTPEETEFETVNFEQQETSSPTPTPEPIQRSEIKIEVLNGTGIAKQAAFLQEKLEELGYEQIETGNADDQQQEETTITVSPNIPNQVRQEIFDELETIYKRVNTSTKSLTDVDIQIIVGLRKEQELPTPTPTSSEKPQPTPTDTDAEESPTPTPTSSPTPTPTTSP